MHTPDHHQLATTVIYKYGCNSKSKLSLLEIPMLCLPPNLATGMDHNPCALTEIPVLVCVCLAVNLIDHWLFCSRLHDLTSFKRQQSCRGFCRSTGVKASAAPKITIYYRKMSQEDWIYRTKIHTGTIVFSRRLLCVPLGGAVTRVRKNR